MSDGPLLTRRRLLALAAASGAVAAAASFLPAIPGDAVAAGLPTDASDAGQHDAPWMEGDRFGGGEVRDSARLLGGHESWMDEISRSGLSEEWRTRAALGL